MVFNVFVRRLLFALVLTLSCALGSFAADDVVATVGEIPITQLEWNLEAQKLLPLAGSYHSGVSEEKVEEVRKEALEGLVERNLKVRYALQEEISIDNAAVDEAYREALGRFGSEEQALQALGEEASTFRASIYRDLLAKKSEEIAVESKVNVTEREVRDYFEANKERFKRPKQFRASHILVKVDPASNAEEREVLKARADGLAERAKSGEDFYNLAYYNSDDRSKYVGGDLGFFHEGQTVKEFEDALLQMKVGEVVGPVKTMFGWHIIKLVEVNEARQLTYDDMKGKIREQLEKEERDGIYEKWISALREQFPVKYMAQ